MDKVRTKMYKEEKEDLKKILEKKIAAAVWLQAIGQISEAALVSKLYLLSEDYDSEGEKKVVAGSWIQAIGQLFEALGVTREISTENPELILEGQREAIIGEFLQVVGGLTTAIGGTEVVYEENIGKTRFVP